MLRALSGAHCQRSPALCARSWRQASCRLSTAAEYLASHAKSDGVTVRPSGLQVRVLASGPQEGEGPGPRSPCVVHYRGTLTDGTEFDCSYARGPATFTPEQVIPGWTEALQAMKKGDKWELTVPPSLGYGARGAPPAIPGNAVLIFEMELLDIKPALSGMSFNNYLAVLAAVGGVGLAAYYLYLGGGLASSSSSSSSSRGKPLLALEQVSSEANPRVYMDIEIGTPPRAAGRIEFELFASTVPKTAENFRALCTGEKGVGGSGRPLSYAGSAFHRIIPQFMVQGGDFTHGNGKGGESIYGAKFEDEWDNGVVGHTAPYLLSMANAGRNTNGSQFFITTARTPHLDGKHVVFGRVTSGEAVVRAVEAAGSRNGEPTRLVRIAACGQL